MTNDLNSSPSVNTQKSVLFLSSPRKIGHLETKNSALSLLCSVKVGISIRKLTAKMAVILSKTNFSY